MNTTSKAGIILLLSFLLLFSTSCGTKKAMPLISEREQVNVPTESREQKPNREQAEAPLKDEREEKITIIQPNDIVEEFNVVCGSFKAKANAEKIVSQLEKDGYCPIIVLNEASGLYRVIVGSFIARRYADQMRNEFKAAYPNNPDFQKTWILKRVY